eukprot:TRINITY_DN106441_c0_g1_i1.p1 TRINITY_DN106441_c0_g1~~TRINITY_DN106441_c0_g1_i1.p1  ORF type:complete len:306 (+),score=47.95 TRINITY_DN106441_c0_g1_i1:39-920(+)
MRNRGLDSFGCKRFRAGAVQALLSAGVVSLLLAAATLARAHVAGVHESVQSQRSTLLPRLDTVTTGVYVEAFEEGGIHLAFKSFGPMLQELGPSLKAFVSGVLWAAGWKLTAPSRVGQSLQMQGAVGKVCESTTLSSVLMVVVAFSLGLGASLLCHLGCRARPKPSSGLLICGDASAGTLTPSLGLREKSESCLQDVIAHTIPTPLRNVSAEAGAAEPPSPAMTESGSGSSGEAESSDDLDSSHHYLEGVNQVQGRVSYPLSQNEKRVRLYQVLDKERVAAVRNSRELKKQKK